MDNELKFTISADSSSLVQETNKAATALSGLEQKAEAVGSKGSSASGAFASSLESLGKGITDFVKSPLESMQSGISGMLTKMGPLAVGIAGVAAGVGLAAKALFDLGAAAADEVESLENLSAQTGMSTQDLQALEEIAKEAGLESLNLGRTIGSLNQQLAEGKGDFVAALDKLNISLTDLSTGKPKDAVTLLDDMRAKLLEIQDPTERAQAAQSALGGRLRELIPLLLNSNGSLRENMEAVKGMGLAYSEAEKQGLKKFDEAMDKLGRVWTTVMNSIKGYIGSVLGNAFAMFESLGEKVAWFGDKLSWVGEKLGIVSPKTAEAATQTQQLAATTDSAAKSTTFFAYTQESLAAQEKDAADAAKKNREEQDRLREAAEKAYRPMDQLSTAIQREIKWFGETAVIRQHADEILKASAKQVQFGGKISESQAKLVELALAFRDGTRQAGGFGPAVEEAGTSVNILGMDIDAFRTKYKGMQDDLAAVQGRPLFPVPTTSESVADLLKPMEPIPQEFGKIGGECRNQFMQQVSTIWTDFSKDLADQIVSGDFNLLDTFKKLGESLLRVLTESLITPLMDSLGKMLTKGIGDLLGGIGIPGLGRLGSSAAGAAGSAAGSAGGAVGGIAGGAMSFGTAALGGAISGLVSGVIGLFKNDHSKDIEANTRYTAIDVHETIRVVQELNTTTWHVRDAIMETGSMINQSIWDTAGMIRDAVASKAPEGTEASAPAGSYQVGTAYVPRSGLYRLEQGEAVLTPAENRARATSIRGGDVNIYLSISGAADDLVQTVKNKVIPILKREMQGGNTGLREAVRLAYDTTAGAY